MTSYAPTVEAARVVDPVTGLVFVELSHPWDAEAPSFPGHPAPTIQRSISHATQGVMTHRITTVMHTGTHVNAPAHLVSRGARVAEIPLDRFFGPGVVLSVPNGIPGVENVGGEIDAITGQRCTFMIFPWRWPGGDGSGVRVVAVVDPDQSFRIERGEP